jgi:hypothetical protein
MKHTCQAHGCKVEVEPKLFMCVQHWRMVPKIYLDAIWASYRPGQENDLKPSQAYILAANAAKGYIAGKENRCARCGRDLVPLNKNSAFSPLACPPCHESTRRTCATEADKPIGNEKQLTLFD